MKRNHRARQPEICTNMKDASKYTEEDIDHMRKVVAYCKRHLAQEGHMKEEKSEEELKQTKSYKSLKNWVGPGSAPRRVKAFKSSNEERNRGAARRETLARDS